MGKKYRDIKTVRFLQYTLTFTPSMQLSSQHSNQTPPVLYHTLDHITAYNSSLEAPMPLPSLN